ncbi:MAG: hypothetical protein V4493_01295 [Pseudomonadota bacterium]
MKNVILYFILGNAPTNTEFEKAALLMNKGPFLEFISLPSFDLNSPIIENVGVAGNVPDEYKHFDVVDVEPDVKPQTELSFE